MLTGKKEQGRKWVAFVLVTISMAGVVGTLMTKQVDFLVL